MSTSKAKWIFHVSSRDMIRHLRDEILRLHGYKVNSTVSFGHVIEGMGTQRYDLVLLDVEGRDVGDSEQLCEAIKKAFPHQQVAFVCNHRVAIHSDCPDEIIRAEFDPEALVRGVEELVPANL